MQCTFTNELLYTNKNNCISITYTPEVKENYMDGGPIYSSLHCMKEMAHIVMQMIAHKEMLSSSLL